MGIYNTPQEERDIKTLQSLGLEVINPNTKEISEKFNNLLKSQMPYDRAFDIVFKELVRQCEVFAFKALPDSKISSGVALELDEAKRYNKIIIELPSSINQRTLSIEATKEYLRDIGER
jgi:hypothetical protein